MLTLVSLVVLGTGQRSKPPAVSEYLNARYGYLVEIPAGLKLRREADNGDGRSYVSPDGRTELLVYGSRTLLDERGEITESLADGYRDRVAQSRAKGRTPRFAAINANAFSVRWTEASRTVHVRTVRLVGGFATIEIRHPRDRKAAFEAAMRRAAASLRSAPFE